MTDSLRSALRSDEDTPTGVDLGAVRTRARTLRRRRATLVAGGAAVVTAAAIVVPVGILGGGGSGPDTGPAAAPAGPTAKLGCPDAYPEKPINAGAGLADRLVPIDTNEGVLCAYTALGKAAEGLAGVLTLSGPEARTAADRLNGGTRMSGEMACTDEYGPKVVLRAGNGNGRAVTVAMESYGCGKVTNGQLTLSAKPVVQELAGEALATTDCAGWSLEAVSTGSTELLPADTRRLLICGEGGGEVIAVDVEATRSGVGRVNAATVLRRAACPTPARQLRVFALTPDRVEVAAVSRECGVVGNGLSSTDDGVVDQLFKAAGQR